MITKFIHQERNPPTNPNFYNTAISALGWQTSRWFQLTAETLGGYFTNEYGKNYVRINAICYNQDNPNVDPWSTNSNTPIITNLFGPYGLGYIPATPAELGNWTGGNAAMINDAINNGAFMIQHNDHGRETGWVDPEYSNSDVEELTNTGLPFVFSINCSSGRYNMPSECFAEKIHRYSYNGQNSGALGVIAASTVDYSFVADTYMWGVYDHMWPDFLPDYGTTPESRGVMPAFGNSAGKYFLEQSNWPYDLYYKQITYAEFHHHGDAFTTIFSEQPQDLTVSHDSTILSSFSSVNITADVGSLIALSVDGEIIGVDTGTGSPISVLIAPQFAPATVKLVVTKQNYYRYETYIDVVAPDGPFVVLNEYEIDDSAGNGNGLLDYGETVYLDMTLHNVGSDVAEDIEVSISSSDPYITIIDGTENFGNLGIDAMFTIAGAFRIEVSNDVPNGHIIDFELTSVFQETTISSFSIESFAPIVEYIGFMIDDTVSGNGDYLWDPGETVDIVVTLENLGDSRAFNVAGDLSTIDLFVTLNTINSQSFGDISSGSTGVAMFNATADTNIPESHLAGFVIDFTADLGISGTGSFTTQVVGYLIEEYFGTFPPSGWTREGGSNWVGSGGNAAGGTSPEADFYWSPPRTGTQRLMSMPINTSGSSSLLFSFKHKLEYHIGGYTLKVQTTSDGTNWNDVWSLSPFGDVEPELLEFEIINSDVGSSTFQIAWVFEGNSSNINNWYVDDVILGVGLHVNGTVSGIVTDSETGFPIAGANIAGLATSGIDGSYTFETIPGTYDITCIHESYYNLIMEDVVIGDEQTTELDFAMLPSNPPENLQAELLNYNEVELSWDAVEIVNSEDSKSIDLKHKSSAQTITRDFVGYNVYMNTEFLEQVTEVSYTIPALDGGNYEFYVTAVYDEGESSPSNLAVLELILPAPTGLTADLLNSDVELNWSAPTSERGLSSYRVYRDNTMIAEDLTTVGYL
ncbi:MAG: hypothetical protein DRR06_18880, partial [Gammaproteobacteria bacterium]